MSNTNTITLPTITNQGNFQAHLVNNVRFTVNNSLNSDKVGSDFTAWKTIASHVQSYAYKVYEASENHESLDAPMSTLINEAIKPMMASIGTLKLYAQDGTAHDVPVTIDDDFIKALSIICIKHAGKVGKKESVALDFVRSQLRNAQTSLRKYEKLNGVNPEAIESLRAQVKQYTDEINARLETPDESVPQPMPAGDASFRKALEIHMGRTLTKQQAMSWEAYQAAKEAKKAERRAATKAKNQAKKQAKSESK